MFSWMRSLRAGPLGLDLGARWLKVVQFSADRQRLLDAARIDLPAAAGGQWTGEFLAKALEKIWQGRHFQGPEVVVCLSDKQVIWQNLRVPKTSPLELSQYVRQELQGRLPFRVEEAELRWLEAGEVRQSANIHREVMAVACHRPVIVSLIQTLEEAGLRPAAIDIEPLALLRSGLMQFRRDDDRDKRLLFAHVGYRHTLIVIVENETPLFIKYIELGGQHFDEAVAAHFGMAPGEASTLRRTSGDRRQDQQDPEITRGVAAALRPVLDRLYEELSLCLRYHSVAFRGTPVSGVVLGGGEACPFLLEELQRRCSLKCDLSEPFRRFPMAPNVARQGQWDVAVGLGLRGLSA